jgi:hypothetical protein
VKHLMIGSLFILAAAMSRLIPHPPNFTPIAAMALVGGVYFDRRYAFVVPILALLASDLIIGVHTSMLWVYGSFLLIAMIGVWLKAHKSPLPIFGAALSGSVIFFVITNFGVWLTGTLYPKTVDGLITCYTMALPFFRNTVAGDLVYTGILFGMFEAVRRYVVTAVTDKA